MLQKKTEALLLRWQKQDSKSCRLPLKYLVFYHNSTKKSQIMLWEVRRAHSALRWEDYGDELGAAESAGSPSGIRISTTHGERRLVPLFRANHQSRATAGEAKQISNLKGCQFTQFNSTKSPEKERNLPADTQPGARIKDANNNTSCHHLGGPTFWQDTRQGLEPNIAKIRFLFHHHHYL